MKRHNSHITKGIATISPEIIAILKDRFTQNMHRHAGLDWPSVQAKVAAQPDKLRSLAEMERTGGEPDVVGYDAKAHVVVFCDCAPESPAGRRSLCYDGAARVARKEHKPAGSALERAAAMGVELLTEQQYRDLQKLGEFDRKTTSWVKTPEAIRTKGGALFCDRRYDHIFVYHNGAESYYGARGFRGSLRV